MKSFQREGLERICTESPAVSSSSTSTQGRRDMTGLMFKMLSSYRVLDVGMELVKFRVWLRLAAEVEVRCWFEPQTVRSREGLAWAGVFVPTKI